MQSMSHADLQLHVIREQTHSCILSLPTVQFFYHLSQFFGVTFRDQHPMCAVLTITITIMVHSLGSFFPVVCNIT